MNEIEQLKQLRERAAVHTVANKNARKFEVVVRFTSLDDMQKFFMILVELGKVKNERV